MEPKFIIVKIIKFYIQSIEYTATEGMTWEEWIESEYNSTKEFIKDNDEIFTSTYYSYKVKYDWNRAVFRTDIITNNYNYILVQESGGSSN